MKRFFALVILLLVLASCESANQPLTPTVPQETLTRSVPDTTICLSLPPLYGALVMFPDGRKPRFYTSGYYPVVCGHGYEPHAVDGPISYKLYFVLADGRKLLFGVDNHPLTVPTTEGPMVDVGSTAYWTFVIEGQGTTFPLMREPHYHEAIMLIELWGPGGKIAEATTVTDEEPSYGRGPKHNRQQ